MENETMQGQLQPLLASAELRDDAGDGWTGVPCTAAGRSVAAHDPGGGVERARRRRLPRLPDGRSGVLAKADRPAHAGRDRRAFLRAQRIATATEGGLVAAARGGSATML